jgi:nucleoid-associated protein YgaU
MRTPVRRRRAVALLVGAAAVWAVGGPVAEAVGLGDGPAPPASHVVRPGETLWSIARALEPGRDPREVVFRIQQANRVDPARLVPGQTLVLPAS